MLRTELLLKYGSLILTVFLMTSTANAAKNAIHPGEIIIANPSEEMAYLADNLGERQRELNNIAESSAEKICQIRSSEVGSKLVNYSLQLRYPQNNEKFIIGKIPHDGQLVESEFQFFSSWYAARSPALTVAELERLQYDILLLTHACTTGIYCIRNTYLRPDWIWKPHNEFDHFYFANATGLAVYWRNDIMNAARRVKELGLRAIYNPRIPDAEVRRKLERGEPLPRIFKWTAHHPHRVYQEVMCE